ncbi:MAG: (d)CMP kinase [candidate division WOR-3 bacterium]|nr:(d)CMP kinase [candidate division WOR-3 bacterium]
MKKNSAGFIIAIDGPAGSGKSTTARLVAQRLGFFHLDTGAMYRAITLKIIEAGIRLTNRRQLQQLLDSTQLNLKWENDRLRVLLDKRDVTEAIRQPAVSALVSPVSAIRSVREKLVAEQRRLAAGRNVVCEGRDIGSVVFPHAQLKIYLDCDLKERARRRLAELKGKANLEQVRKNLAERDRIDSHRRHSPLRRARDAILIDTTHLTIEEQVALVCALARRRLADPD